MWEIFKRNPRAAGIAIFMHVAIILFMVVGVDWLERPQAVTPQVAVVQATVIDQSELDAEVAKLKQAEEQKKAATEAARKQEEDRLAELKRKQAEEKKRLEELEQAREQEEQKKIEAQRQRKLDEQKRLEEEKKRKLEEQKRAEEEKKRLEEEKRKAEEEKKRKAEAEKKRKAEEEKRRKAEEEKKRKAEAEAKRKAEQKAREDALLAQMEAEHNDREMGRYIALITNKIERNWLRPPNTEGLKCTVRVRLIPSGDVVPGSVVIVKSSGNNAFDRSVEQAVYKAQPLDVPKGALFERFREVDFLFDPSRN